MTDKIKSSVLIVDDSTINIRIVSKMIEELKHQILVANSGIEALKLLTKESPNLILLDINMPDMDGFECCKRIKKSVSRAHIPIIFMSGSHDEQDKLKAKSIGGASYMTKPIDREQLLSEIEFQMPWQESGQR